ncbi:MAG: protein kinase domain-containing protein [Phocaeicola sp.]
MKRKEPLYRIAREKQLFFVHKPHPAFKTIESYQQAFKAQAALEESWSHPNLFSCLGTLELEGDWVILYAYKSAAPLHRAILEDSSNLREPKMCQWVMHQLLNAVEYIHQQGALHANIRPENIYIEPKTGQLKLVNSAQCYLHTSPSFLLIHTTYTAPELVNEAASHSLTTEIYSIGKIMEFLYSYSKVSLGLNRIIKRATHSNPSKRYRSINELRKALQKAHYWDWGVRGVKIAACAGIVALLSYGFGNKPDSEENLLFFEESRLTQEEKKRSEEAITTDYLSPFVEQTTHTPSPENGELNEEKQMGIKLFRKEFKRAAIPVIQRIYTPQLMNGSEQSFQEESLDGFAELDRVQRQLSEELGISLREATTIATEVISELTQESMNRLQNR